MSDQMRKEFEAWAVKRGMSLIRASSSDLFDNGQESKKGGYMQYGTICAWESWQASRKDIEIELPPRIEDGVLRSYARMPMPDEKLKKLSAEELDFYASALYFCSLESSTYWKRGQSMLEIMGFKKNTREAGHRGFTGMKYRGKEE